MADGKGKGVHRVAGSARRVIAPALATVLVVGLWIVADLAKAHDHDWPWRTGIVVLVLIWWWSEHRGVGSRLTRALSERAVRSDAAWAVISRILGVARRSRAAFDRLFDTPPFRMLARLALPLAILLTAAMAYRLAAMPVLLAREGVYTGSDLAVLSLDWVLFGLGYGLVGAAAPVVALLLLLRRRRYSLGIAMVLHVFGLLGVCLAVFRAIFTGPDGPDGMTQLVHPLFAQPENAVFVIVLLAGEFIAGVAALYLLGRPRVQRHYGEPATDGTDGRPGPAAD